MPCSRLQTGQERETGQGRGLRKAQRECHVEAGWEVRREEEVPEGEARRGRPGLTCQATAGAQTLRQGSEGLHLCAEEEGRQGQRGSRSPSIWAIEAPASVA